MQKWIDDALEKKLLVRRTVFYLGTTYEETRAKDERLDKLLEEPEVKVEKQYVYIDAELLSDQLRSIEIMEKPKKSVEAIMSELKFFFREVDTQNIGVVTRPEFLKIVDNLGLKLSEEEKQQVLQRIDNENTGTILYQKYEEIVSEILEAKQAKKDAEEMLEDQRAEEIFTTILTLINDDVQGIQRELVEHFKANDEDETGMTNISEVKTALEKINKKFKDANKSEPLTPIEMAEITKILTDSYGYKTIPYANIHSHIIEFKIKSFSSGLINSKVNKLEAYIRQICDQFDEKKFGRIKVSSLIEAIQKSQKIHLTKAQIYLLESILPMDSKNQISYMESSKFLAELIKKFYIHSSKKKEASL